MVAFYRSNASALVYAIKGPYVEPRHVLSQLQTKRLGYLLGLPGHARLEDHTSATYAEGHFYIAACYIPIDPKAYQLCSSKLETNVPIYTGNHYHLSLADLRCASERTQVQFFITLAFRYIALANDTVFRNLLLFNGDVYSVDDHVANEPPKIMIQAKTSAEVTAYCAVALTRLWTSVSATLTDWIYVLERSAQDFPTALQRLRFLQAKENWKFF